MADIEPLRMLPHSIYKCDSRFHTELLREQLSDDTRYGFIVIDGSCASFHVLVGDTRQTIFKKDVQLPKKHGRGGQSQNRFARIREEKRDWYTTEIAEYATKHFIDLATNKVNIKALIVSGSANLKNEMIKKLDPRVQKAILNTYDVQYSGEAGFAQTLVLCEADLVDSRYTFEKGLLAKFYNCISSNDGLYTFSPSDTIYALEAGAVETLLVWNELPLIRYVLTQHSTGTTKVVYKTESPTNNADITEEDKWEVTDSQPLLDWVLEHYKEFGSDIQVISGKSSLGNQFVQGFGGVGSILRYPVEMTGVAEADEDSGEDDYSFEY